MTAIPYPPPRYGGHTGRVTAAFRPTDTAPDLVIPRDPDVDPERQPELTQRSEYLATAEQTAGDYGLYRIQLPPHAAGAPPHFHRGMSEAFYVLSGVIGFYNGETWFDGGPGDFLHVPPGGLHGFTNSSDDPVTMLLLFTPGGPREEYFENVRFAAELPEDERAEFFAFHDNHLV